MDLRSALDSLFTALDLSVFKPWSVRPAQESDCTATVCGSHVKRVLTSDGGSGSLLDAIPDVLTTFSSCVEAERVETVFGQASRELDCTVLTAAPM